MKDDILEILKNRDKALTLMEINDALHLESIDEYKELHKVVTELVSEGKIHKTKKEKFMLMDNCSSLLTGYLHINKKGNGFVDTKLDEDTLNNLKYLNYNK